MMNINIIGIMALLIVSMAHAEVGLPDPTRPANYSLTRVITQETARQRVEFSVNAIRISEHDRSAIINGAIVRVGDDIGAARVKEINAAAVVLDYERKQVIVPLYVQGISKQFKTSKIKD